MLVLTTVVVILFPLVMASVHLMWLAAAQQRLQSALDAAALKAASDLSRVTINDRHFGFVALSNHPPVGRGCLASTGKALPVESFNALVGTARLASLLATDLGDQTMQGLATTDCENIKVTASALNEALNRAISPSLSLASPTDWDGQKVNALADAKRIFLNDLADSWLGHSSQTAQFKAQLLSQLKSSDTGVLSMPSRSGNSASTQRYEAFRDYPVGTQHFFFTAVGKETALTSSTDSFRGSSSDCINSICRLDAYCTVGDPLIPSCLRDILKIDTTLHLTSSAVPACEPDITPPGVLTVEFANGQIPNIHCLRDLLTSGQLSSSEALIYKVTGGNYPEDDGSCLVQTSGPGTERQTSAGEVVATAIFDWLRNCHCRPTLESVNEILDFTFPNQNGKLAVIFDLTPTGKLVVRSCQQSPFSPTLVSEQQLIAQCNSCTQFPCTMILRDEVRNIGTMAGGKDAGQAVAGDTVNWCDLSLFGARPEQALACGKGAEALGVYLTGMPNQEYKDPQTVARGSTVFLSAYSRNRCESQPRESYYGGGLAVDIQFGNPQAD